MSNKPLISIIIPCRNEEKFIDKCLDSIIAQDYPKEKLQISVIDEMSADGTSEIIKVYAQRSPSIKFLDNPKKITPCTLNLGIRNAKGELILWINAHNKYEKSFVL